MSDRVNVHFHQVVLANSDVGIRTLCSKQFDRVTSIYRIKESVPEAQNSSLVHKGRVLAENLVLANIVDPGQTDADFYIVPTKSSRNPAVVYSEPNLPPSIAGLVSTTGQLFVINGTVFEYSYVNGTPRLEKCRVDESRNPISSRQRLSAPIPPAEPNNANDPLPLVIRTLVFLLIFTQEAGPLKLILLVLASIVAVLVLSNKINLSSRFFLLRTTPNEHNLSLAASISREAFGFVVSLFPGSERGIE